MTNYELQKLTVAVDRSDYPEYRAPDLALELARRELQRMNPRGVEDPCVFKKRVRTSCFYGSYGCEQPHGRASTSDQSAGDK